MYKQVSFVITASIILTAFLTIEVYTGSEAHAQAAGANATAAGANATAAGANATAAGANATAAGNMTKSANATAAGNMTQPLAGANASKHLSTGYGVQG